MPLSLMMDRGRVEKGWLGQFSQNAPSAGIRPSPEKCALQSSGVAQFLRAWVGLRRTDHRSRLFQNRIAHYGLIGDRHPQHQTVLRPKIAVAVAFGRGQVFDELDVAGI